MKYSYGNRNMLPDNLALASFSVQGCTSVNKFGRATNCDNGVATDVHDGANATDDVDIWVAPTQARTHQITSTSTNDTAAGTGARTIKIYGLTDWDTAEVSETITMNGTSNVATANDYVIIHRMKVLTKGASGPNVGVITATADTDSTVTAQINAGEGQTQMAVYGVPSTHTAYVSQYYAGAIKTSTAITVGVALLANPEPGDEVTSFVTKHTIGLDTTGSSYVNHQFAPFAGFVGPAILKVQVNSSANNADVSAGFDLVLVEN